MTAQKFNIEIKAGQEIEIKGRTYTVLGIETVEDIAANGHENTARYFESKGGVCKVHLLNSIGGWSEIGYFGSKNSRRREGVVYHTWGAITQWSKTNDFEEFMKSMGKQYRLSL